MRVTLCARSQLLQQSAYGTFRIEALMVPFAGLLIDLTLIPERLAEDSIMSEAPTIVAAPADAALLRNQVIDFDFTSNQFIISRRERE